MQAGEERQLLVRAAERSSKLLSVGTGESTSNTTVRSAPVTSCADRTGRGGHGDSRWTPWGSGSRLKHPSPQPLNPPHPAHLGHTGSRICHCCCLSRAAQLPSTKNSRGFHPPNESVCGDPRERNVKKGLHGGRHCPFTVSAAAAHRTPGLVNETLVRGTQHALTLPLSWPPIQTWATLSPAAVHWTW